MYFEWGGVCEEIDAGWVAENKVVVGEGAPIPQLDKRPAFMPGKEISRTRQVFSDIPNRFDNRWKVLL